MAYIHEGASGTSNSYIADNVLPEFKAVHLHVYVRVYTYAQTRDSCFFYALSYELNKIIQR